MKDLLFTWKDYLLEQLEEEHVGKKICELEAAFQRDDDDPEYSLSYVVFSGPSREVIVLPTEDRTAAPTHPIDGLIDFTNLKNEVDRNHSCILLDTIREMN